MRKTEIKTGQKALIFILAAAVAALSFGCAGKTTDQSSTTVETSVTSLAPQDTTKAGKTETEKDGSGSDETEKVPEISISAGVSEEKSIFFSGEGEDSGDVERDPKFNSVNVDLTPAQMEDAGFSLGDSCDVIFSNGYALTDVPYYNGYYVKNGEPVIVAYPGYENISITLNNQGIWDAAGLQDGDRVTIRLNEKGKYSAVQESLGQSYLDDREFYESDESFCNFRALTGGSLKENFLYRGASPVDNTHNRPAYTDKLLEAREIKFIVDLADSQEDMEGYLASADFNSPYTRALYENGSVALLDMGSAYQSEVYQQKLVTGLRGMMAAQGPVYIHCMEGKDRTGFVCMLLEALAGATYEEMSRDYMITYYNYYGVSEEDTPITYAAIQALYFDAFVEYLHGTDDLDVLMEADYTEDAKNYLMAGGMTEEEVQKLADWISQ